VDNRQEDAVAQKTFDVMERIGRAHMTRGDRLIAVSAARGAEPAVELLYKICSKIQSAVALAEPVLFPQGSTDL
jgi:hypothetical protein